MSRRTIYHILPETEPYSEFRGGAISRWVANVLSGDNSAVVVCADADGTWVSAGPRVRTVPGLHRYCRYRWLGNKVGWALRRRVLKWTLDSALNSLEPGDVVWLHNRPETAAAIGPKLRAAQVKFVVHMHNSHLARASTRRTKDIQADCYVFVSQFLQEEASAHQQGITKSCVLYNGADERIFYPRQTRFEDPDEGPTILFASRLVPDKGAHVFIAAMRELSRRKIQSRGLIVGASHFGGSDVTHYIRQLHRDAPPNVSFHPYCVGSQLGELFRGADIFCLPSTWQDPFPLAPLEAMACRIPVIATRSGGIPEALSDGGGIVVARNSVSELVSALEKLILHPPLRRQLGAAGEESFRRNFTWKAVRRQYDAVLASLPPLTQGSIV